MRKRVVIAIGVGIIAIVVGAFLVVPYFTPSQLKQISVATTPFIAAGINQWVAYEEGFWAKEHLNVTMAVLASTDLINKGIAAGQYNAAAEGVSTGLFNNIAQGFNVKFVSGVEYFTGGDNGTASIIVSKNAYDAGVRTVKDLRGHSLAQTLVGSVAWAHVYLLLKNNGMTLNDVKLINTGNPTQTLQLLQGGKVDAAQLDEPFRTLALQSGTTVEIATMSDAFPKGKLFERSIMLMTSDFVAKNPDIVKAYLKGYEAAVNWVNSALKKGQGPEYNRLTQIVEKYSGVKPDVFKQVRHNTYSVEIQGLDSLLGYQQIFVEGGSQRQIIQPNDLVVPGITLISTSR